MKHQISRFHQIPLDFEKLNYSKNCSNLGKALAALGYKKVNLITFKGLRHQLSTVQFEDIMEFYRQLLPHRREEPYPAVSMPQPSGCIVWMHDASIAGDVDQEVLRGRQLLILLNLQNVIRCH